MKSLNNAFWNSSWLARHERNMVLDFKRHCLKRDIEHWQAKMKTENKFI